MVHAADEPICSQEFSSQIQGMSIQELAGMIHHEHENRDDLDVMMVNECEGRQIGEASTEVLEDAMVLIEEQHDVRALAQAPQDQRDRVMRSLITSSQNLGRSTSSDPDGAQAEQDRGSGGRALRLFSDGAGEQERPPLHGTAVSWRTRGGPQRARIQDRFQQIRDAGVMSPLQNTHDLHACVWLPHDTQGRTLESRRQGADSEERCDERNSPVEEREDQLGRSREVSREAVGSDSFQEGSVGSYAESEGEGKGWLPPGSRPPGFESDFNNCQSDGEASRDGIGSWKKGKTGSRVDRRGEGVRREIGRRQLVTSEPSERNAGLYTVKEETDSTRQHYDEFRCRGA